MPEDHRFYDLFFIYHPDNVSIVRRIAAQLNAMGSVCRFEEDDFRKSALDIAELKDGVLRSHAVGFVLSPESAASQLCNELVQHAVNNSKRLVSLIVDEDIEVEVHPAIADNPYVFFRERDNLAEQVDELRQYLRVDHETRLHTELLVAADMWQRRGRRPSQLLPPERIAEARKWLADAPIGTLKPSPTLVEFIHNSRRQRTPSARSLPRLRLGLALLVVFVLAAGFFLLRAALDANRAAQAAAAQTQAAQTQLALTGAAATAASDSAVSLVDALAATSAVLAESVIQTADAVAADATQAVYASETANAVATVARATEIYEQARDADAARLVDAAENALEQGDRELALALAWVAKDALDDPKPAIRVLRRATAQSSSAMLAAEALPLFQPGGMHFALVANTDAGASLRLYESASWTLVAELSEHEAPITQLAYSPDGSRLVSASRDGEIVLRAPDSGVVIRRLGGHDGAVTALAFSPGSDQFYSAGSEPMLAAWDLDSGAMLADYSPGEAPAFAVDELLVTGDGGPIIGWATVDGKPVMAQWTALTLEPVSAETELVYRGVDAAGRYGYSGGRSLPAYPGDPNTGGLVIWDVASGDEITRLNDGFNWSLGDLTAPSDDLLFISFREPVALVGVTSSDGVQRAMLVNLADGSVTRRFDTETAADLKSSHFVDGETALSLTRGGRLLLWSLVDGSVIRDIGSAGRNLVEIGFNRESNTVVGWAGDGHVQLWRLSESGGAAGESLTDALPGSGISPSGDVMHLLSADGLRFVSLDTGETITDIEARLVKLRGAFLSASGGGRVTLYDSESGDELEVWTGEWDSLLALHISADGERLLALDEGGSLWLLARGREEPLPLDAISTSAPSRVEFSADGERMLVLRDKRAILWDVKSSQALGAYALDSEAVAGVDAAFGTDGDTLLFYVQLDNGVASLTALTDTENVTRRNTFLDVTAGALARDGSALMLARSEGGLLIIGAADGEATHHLPGATEIPDHWRYLPDAGLLAIAADHELLIWDVSDGRLDHRFALGQPIAGFSVSDDGQVILARGSDGAHRLWRIESREELLRRIEADSPARDLTCAERVRFLVLPLCE